jgi:hypothetical protein
VSGIGICGKNGRDNRQGTEFLADAVYDGTLASFLKGWFPEQRQ